MTQTWRKSRQAGHWRRGDWLVSQCWGWLGARTVEDKPGLGTPREPQRSEEDAEAVLARRRIGGGRERSCCRTAAVLHRGRAQPTAPWDAAISRAGALPAARMPRQKVGQHNSCPACAWIGRRRCPAGRVGSSSRRSSSTTPRSMPKNASNIRSSVIDAAYPNQVPHRRRPVRDRRCYCAVHHDV
jgi:hypothetical protein